MPRRSRFSTGGYVFHVLNRAVGRQAIFRTDADYDAMLRVIEDSRCACRMRILAYVVMPNHWHLVLWPEADEDLSTYMHRLTLAHTKRFQKVHETTGYGPLYQGRFKSFPLETDERFLQVCRYVERNPLRARLVELAENWRWSSLWQWQDCRCDVTLTAWPVARPVNWIEYVNSVESEGELEALRHSVVRGAPFGNTAWRRETAIRLGLEKTLRLRGRPRA